jgi:hypothetical protein
LGAVQLTVIVRLPGSARTAVGTAGGTAAIAGTELAAIVVATASSTEALPTTHRGSPRRFRVSAVRNT